MTETSKEIGFAMTPNLEALTFGNSTFPLKHVPSIYHLVRFKKNQAKVRSLLDSDNEVNVKTLAYIARLGFQVWSSNVRVQKINDSTFHKFGMILASFQIKNKLRKAHFFQKTFLQSNISIDMVLDMLFWTFSNADILFAVWELIWRSYIPAMALLTIKRVELIDKKEFIKAALDKNFITFVMYIAALEAPPASEKRTIHLFWIAQITGEDFVQVVAL